MSDLKEYSLEEIAKHDKKEDCWIILGNEENGGPKVYNITNYLDEHPAGDQIVLEYAGKDAEEAFSNACHSQNAKAIAKTFLIGTVKEDPEFLANRKTKKQKTPGSPLAVIVVLLAILVAVYLLQTRQQ
eukprot:gene9799-10837_t